MNEEASLKEQVIKEQDVKEQPFDNSGENPIDGKDIKRYEKELLLKLRVYPLSLQKPKGLPNLSIIKNKAQLQHITDYKAKANVEHASSRPLSSSLFPSITRSDNYRTVGSHSQAQPAYFNRMYPSHVSSRLKKTLSSTSSPFFDYDSFATPTRLHQLYRSSRYPCDSLETNIWNCYRGYSSSHEQTAKDHITIPKGKKKIAIIDPVTGKNVLETISSTSHQETPCEVSEASSNSEQHLKTNSSFQTNKEGNVVQTDDLKTLCVRNLGNGDSNESSFTDSVYPGNSFGSSQDQIFSDSSSQSMSFSSAVDEMKVQMPGSCECNTAEKEFKTNKKVIHEKEYQTLDGYQQAAKEENFDLKGSFEELHDATDTEDTTSSVNSEVLERDRDIKFKRQIDIDAKLLKDSIYALKKEQQQISMLKTFLLNKKHQLDETACLIEEKKIELTDLDYYLINKEQQLKRKEYLLATREAVLLNIEKKLETREQQLNIMKSHLKYNQNQINFPKAHSIRKGENDQRFHLPKQEISNINATTIQDNVKSLVHDTPSPQNKEESASNDDKRLHGLNTVKNFEEQMFSKRNQELLSTKSEDAAHARSDAPCDNKCENVTEMKELKISTQASQDEDISLHKPISMGRKYLPMYLQFWLEKKEKMAEQGDCSYENENSCLLDKMKFAEEELKVQNPVINPGKDLES